MRRILCPFDYSDFSRRGLDLAFALATPSSAEVTVLRVVQPPFPGFPASFPLDPAIGEWLRTELARFVAPSQPPDVPMRTVVVGGAPVTRILQEAGELGADLIVMGTHGAGGFERWMLGSVAEKVLGKAPCPVLTVTKERDETYPLDAGHFGEVVCALDVSEASEHTLANAVSMTRAAGERLTLLYVLEESPPEEAAVADAGLDLSAYRAERSEDARQRLRALAKDVSCAHQEIVRVGKPFREILRLAEEQRSGLIVVGAHGGGFLDLHHLGSTTHRVVRGATCPVLTVRERR